ncbi:MAG: hypothetical protein V3V08_23120 [Nannocystaceae bacterium]
MKKFVSASLFSLSLIVALGGCMKNQYTVGTGAPTDGEPDASRWNAHWVFGLLGEDNAEVAKICPSGNATIKERTTFVNGLIGSLALVGVIYKPTTVNVWCANGNTATMSLSAEQMRRAALTAEARDLAREDSDELAAYLAATQLEYLATH